MNLDQLLGWRTLRNARRRFRHDLIGTWGTEFGGGEDMAHGIVIRFDPSGEGAMESWSAGDSTASTFRWQRAEPFVIEIVSDGVASRVRYDFDIRKGRITLFELDRQLIPGSRSFWFVPYELVLMGGPVVG